MRMGVYLLTLQIHSEETANLVATALRSRAHPFHHLPFVFLLASSMSVCSIQPLPHTHVPHPYLNRPIPLPNTDTTPHEPNLPFLDPPTPPYNACTPFSVVYARLYNALRLYGVGSCRASGELPSSVGENLAE